MNSLAYRHTMKKHKLGDFNVNLRSYAWFAKQISNLENKKKGVAFYFVILCRPIYLGLRSR